MTHYKIAPSSLTFLYEDCKRCFWLDIHKHWKRPFMPFPSVFGRIDKAMRAFYHDRPIHEVVKGLPTGTIDTSGRKVASRAIEVQGSAASIQLSGSMDCLVRFSDGTVGVIDFKTSEAKAQHIELYKRQLHAYTAILQQPQTGRAETVSRMGLIAVTPSTMRLDDAGQAVFSMDVCWQKVAIEPAWWDAFLSEIVELLEGLEPAGKHDCPYCAMQRGLLAIGQS